MSDSLKSDQTSLRDYTKLFPSETNGNLFRLNSDPDSAAHIEVVETNPLARVIKYTIKPGEHTGWHYHHLEFLTIQLSAGTLTNYIANDYSQTKSAIGKETHFVPGTAVSHKAPLLHNAVNTGDTDIIAFEVEFIDAKASARMSDFDH